MQNRTAPHALIDHPSRSWCGRGCGGTSSAVLGGGSASRLHLTAFFFFLFFSSSVFASFCDGHLFHFCWPGIILISMRVFPGVPRSSGSVRPQPDSDKGEKAEGRRAVAFSNQDRLSNPSNGRPSLRSVDDSTIHSKPGQPNSKGFLSVSWTARCDAVEANQVFYFWTNPFTELTPVAPVWTWPATRQAPSWPFTPSLVSCLP